MFPNADHTASENKNFRCFLFLRLLRCFTSAGALPAFAGYPEFIGTGFPIRKPPDQRLLTTSPKISPARGVLHRLCMPRHPPYALIIFVVCNSFPSTADMNHVTWIRIMNVKMNYYTNIFFAPHCKESYLQLLDFACRNLKSDKQDPYITYSSFNVLSVSRQKSIQPSVHSSLRSVYQQTIWSSLFFRQVLLWRDIHPSRPTVFLQWGRRSVYIVRLRSSFLLRNAQKKQKIRGSRGFGTISFQKTNKTNRSSRRA